MSDCYVIKSNKSKPMKSNDYTFDYWTECEFTGILGIGNIKKFFIDGKVVSGMEFKSKYG